MSTGKTSAGQGCLAGCLLVAAAGVWMFSGERVATSSKVVEAARHPIFTEMDNRLAWEAKWARKPMTVNGALVRTGRDGGTAWAVFRGIFGENVNALVASDEVLKVLEGMKIGQRAEVSGIVRGIAKDGAAVEVYVETVVPK